VDIDAFTKGLGLIGSAIATIKQVIELLPDSPKKDEAMVALKQAERELKIAEGETARELGYEICRKHFPPEIMLSEDDSTWSCPICGNEKYTGPAGMTVYPGRLT
jgi:hypothetical protein